MTLNFTDEQAQAALDLQDTDQDYPLSEFMDVVNQSLPTVSPFFDKLLAKPQSTVVGSPENDPHGYVRRAMASYSVRTSYERELGVALTMQTDGSVIATTDSSSPAWLAAVKPLSVDQIKQLFPQGFALVEKLVERILNTRDFAFHDPEKEGHNTEQALREHQMIFACAAARNGIETAFGVNMWFINCHRGEGVPADPSPDAQTKAEKGKSRNHQVALQSPYNRDC